MGNDHNMILLEAMKSMFELVTANLNGGTQYPQKDDTQTHKCSIRKSSKMSE